jgi:hypothetical protein
VGVLMVALYILVSLTTDQSAGGMSLSLVGGDHSLS